MPITTCPRGAQLRAFVSLLALFLLLAGCSSGDGAAATSGSPALASASAPSDPIASNHPRLAPPSVPTSYAATPYGFFHPSCMVQVQPGDTALGDGSVRTAKGEIVHVEGCSAPRFDPTGRAMPVGSMRGAATRVADATNAAASGGYSGWIESYNSTATGALSYLAATWVVPAAPSAPNDGQTIYFFNGLEGLPTVESILQPVLGFSNGHWTATSWNCCKQGTTYYGNTIDVSPGDVIVGTISGAGCNTSSGICDTWSIETRDQTTGQAATLQTSAWGVAENWVFAGVLEVYGVSRCEDLPASGQLAFTNQRYTSVSGSGASPSWSLGLGSVSPSCGYGGVNGGSSVTLDFTAAGSAPPSGGGGVAVGGSYALRSAANPGSCLDVNADGTANLTQIDEYTCNGTPAQTFTVRGASNGLVTLVQPHSGKCVDVYASGTADGTNVDLYDCNGTGAQEWSVQTDAAGLVTFVNPNSGKCLDVPGASGAAFTKMEIWDCNGGNNQKWRPVAGGLTPGASYAFETQLGTASCLDVYASGVADGTQVEEYACNGTGAQTFQIQSAGGGLVSIVEPASGKCLDLYSAGTADGTKVEIWTCNGTPAQQFLVQSDAAQNVTFVNPHSGKCLDVNGASTANYTKVQLWDCNGGLGQTWTPSSR